MSDRFTQRRLDLRRQRWFQVVVGVIAIALIGTIGWLIWFSSVLTVRSVEISGETTLTQKQVQDAAAVPMGRPLARTDLTAIETRVKQVPRVRTASVSRSWPHTISIEIEERTAVMWMTVGGEIHGVDRYGIDYRTYGKKPKGLVEARVMTYDADVKLSTTRAVAEVADYLRREKPSWLGDLRVISGATQDSVSLELTKGRTIVWGSTAHGARKIEVLESLLTVKKGTRTYDVSAPDQPTTKG